MQKKDNIIIFLNILMFIFIFWIVFLFQSNFYIVIHDYFSPFLEEFNYSCRIPAAVLYRFTQNILPKVLSIHSQDFIVGIGAFIKSALFMSVCCVFSLGFFINSKESFKNKCQMNLIVFPLCFILSSCLFYSEFDFYTSFGQIKETVVYFEYFAGLLFYFAFFVCFLYVIPKNEKISLFLKILIILNSFLLGFWNELFNVATFFSIVLLFIFFIIFRYNNFHIRKLLIFVVPFFIGLICFYIYSDYFTGDSIASHVYGENELITTIKSSFIPFFECYFNTLFIDKLIFWFAIIILSFLIYTKKYYNNILLITVFSIIAGYLIMNLFLIIYKDAPDVGYSGFLFDRNLYKCLYINVMGFVIVILLGCLYNEYEKYRKYIAGILLLLLLLLTSVFFTRYKYSNTEDLNNRAVCYLFEKILVTYHLLGEHAIMPKSVLNVKEYGLYMYIYPFNHNFNYKMNEDNFKDGLFINSMENRYFDKPYIYFYYYFQYEYGMKFIGMRFVDDQVAYKELIKRLKLLNSIKRIKRINRRGNIKKISFEPLKELKDRGKITLEDINKIKVDKGNENIILKLKAYIYYRDGDFNKSLNLYNDYLVKNPNDFDALINVADIYMKKNNINKAYEIYNLLHELNPDNLTFMYKLLILNYNYKQNYEDALKICNLMIEQQDNMMSLYMNKYIILLAMGNTGEAKKILDYVNSENNLIINNFMVVNKISNFDNLYKERKKIKLMNLEFYD